MPGSAKNRSGAQAITWKRQLIGRLSRDCFGIRHFLRQHSVWRCSPSPWAESQSWVPTFLQPSRWFIGCGSEHGRWEPTVVDGILGTLIGGWIAQRWLRTNHRALYLAVVLERGSHLAVRHTASFSDLEVDDSSLFLGGILSVSSTPATEHGNREFSLGAGPRHGDIASICSAFIFLATRFRRRSSARYPTARISASALARRLSFSFFRVHFFLVGSRFAPPLNGSTLPSKQSDSRPVPAVEL